MLQETHNKFVDLQKSLTDEQFEHVRQNESCTLQRIPECTKMIMVSVNGS